MKPRCAFGAVWPCGPCRGCIEKADQLEAQFWRAVFFGEYDADGYTPAERKAQQRKATR